MATVNSTQSPMKITALAALALAGLISACGGGGGGSASVTTPPPPPPNASPGGIWAGTESVSGLQVTGLVDEAGDLAFVRSDGATYFGTAAVTGSSLSANIDGFTPPGTAYADGSVHGTGTLSGTLVARTSANLTTKFTTDSGGVTNGTLNLTFNAVYNSASSFAALAGNFTDGSMLCVRGVCTPSSAITIHSDGTIFAQDAGTGCVINGSLSIVNAAYNAYKVSLTYQSCTGVSAVLNGATLSGLATLDTASNPQRVIAAAEGKINGTTYGVSYVLTRS